MPQVSSLRIIDPGKSAVIPSEFLMNWFDEKGFAIPCNFASKRTVNWDNQEFELTMEIKAEENKPKYIASKVDENLTTSSNTATGALRDLFVLKFSKQSPKFSGPQSFGYREVAPQPPKQAKTLNPVPDASKIIRKLLLGTNVEPSKADVTIFIILLLKNF